MKCDYCELIEAEKNAEIIYQDNDIAIVVKDTALTPGQITIFPKKHYTIMENAPEEIIQKCMRLANKVSVAIFESLATNGTNIVIQNGLGGGQKVPHFCIEIYPRQENDGLPLQWTSKKLDDVDLETTFNIIKEELAKEEKEEKHKEDLKLQVEKALKEDKQPNQKTEQQKIENYLVKSIKRMP
ncbi:HIT family protein [Candidatus Woesearchaeota archaeon]|nr:HIT family protein [Candidatus Woesearchaeota archaeon]